jgi:uncharacterized protein
MDRTLSNFIRALRNAEVRISTAETLDAFNTVELVGYRDRQFLKDSLALVLPKTEAEKQTYDACFDQFFKFHEVDDRLRERPTGAAEDGDAEGDGSEGGDGEGGGGGAETGEAERGGKRKKKRKGGPAEAAADIADQDLGPGEMSDAQSRLGQLLMGNSRIQVSLSISAAGRDVNVQGITVFTQKGLYARKIMDAMGLADLQQEIGSLKQSRRAPDRRLSVELAHRREWLREQVRDHVEQQFLLHADATGRRVREEMLRKVKLSNIEQRNQHMIQEVVFRMAKKLISMHSRRRKVFKRGQLHLPRTLRHNMSYDGMIWDLHWKSKKIDRPKVFAICDVSGSVADYAKFMLMFLYSLEEVMPNVRSFAFSSDLAEVTDIFRRNKLEDAIAKTLRDYASGSTNYTQAFADFRKLCMDDVDSRTTIIVLGDARNNYGDPRTEVLKEMYDRSKRMIWLNPEPRSVWYQGDSEMRRYSAYCHQVEECNSLMHLERVVGNLLRAVN